MSEPKWYVLRAISGQEKKVKNYLDNEIQRKGLQDYIPEVMIPTEKVFEMRQGKKKVREKSFFPGYIIISADFNHGETLHTINSVPGVLGFLGSGDSKANTTPTPLRPSEINRILGKVDENDEEELQAENQFHVGESVKVMDGPFSGFTGSIEEVNEEKKKLTVTVKIFGRNTPLELNYMQVEKEK